MSATTSNPAPATPPTDQTPSRRTTQTGIAAHVPALGWLRTYSRPQFRGDLVAGVTVAAVAVPEDMAYAAMAGLSPQVGLYASLVSLLVYAVLGTSRHLSYGVTSALSIMVAGSLGAMAFTDDAHYAAAAGFVAIASGIMALLAWVFRLGVIANFVSETVLVGFSAGAALYIGSSQVSKLFGIHGVQGTFFERIWNVIRHLGETNGWTLAVGLVSLLLVVVLEERIPRLPGPLVVVILAILVMWQSDLEERGVEVAGRIAQGLPTPSIPRITSGDLPELLGLAFGVFLLSYVEGIGVAKTLAARHKEKIDANQELLANGVANLTSGLFRGYAVGGSMSRSAVSEAAGAVTPATGAIAAVLLGVILLVLTGPFQYLPEATLAAIVLIAVRHLFNAKAIRRIWELDRQEFIAAFATFIGVLTFGMLEGILIGVGMTFLLLLRRISAPHTSLLGRRPGTDDFVALSRNPDAEQLEDVLIFRADSGWFYANAPVMEAQLTEAVESMATPPRLVVIDMATAPMVDLGVVDTLADVTEDLRRQGVRVAFANVYATVAERLRQTGDVFDDLRSNESVAEVLGRSQADSERVGGHERMEGNGPNRATDL